jgi:hypothetical protein
MVSRLEIEQARSDLSKVTDTINMLRTEGLDASTAELLLSRKKYELQNLMAWQGGNAALIAWRSTQRSTTRERQTLRAFSGGRSGRTITALGLKVKATRYSHSAKRPTPIGL